VRPSVRQSGGVGRPAPSDSLNGIGVSPPLRVRCARLRVRASLGAAKYPEPLCQPWVLPAAAASPARCRKALPFLRRSYRLMRQTKTLPSPRFLGLSERSSQVVVSPCWEMALPDVISTICVESPGPIPRRVPAGANTRFFPEDIGFTLRGRSLARETTPCITTSQGTLISGLQSFTNVQAPILAWPSNCSDQGILIPLGQKAVYTGQNPFRYRIQAPALLRVRIRTIDTTGLVVAYATTHLLDRSLVGCS